MTDNEYTTTDFYTAAVLISEDFKVLQVSSTSTNGKVKKFHFENNENLKKVHMEYLNGTLVGNIRKFKNAIETVKDMIHSS